MVGTGVGAGVGVGAKVGVCAAVGEGVGLCVASKGFSVGETSGVGVAPCVTKVAEGSKQAESSERANSKAQTFVRIFIRTVPF